MTKAMAVRNSNAYRLGAAFRRALGNAASKVGDVARGGANTVRSGKDAVRDFARGVAGK